MALKKLRNRMSAWSIFSLKGGEVFESIRDTQISYLTHFMVPYTGGDTGVILRGERVLVRKPVNQKPSGYYCLPLNMEEVEDRIIPKGDRDDPNYDGFSLFIDAISLKKDFRPIELMPMKFIKGDATNPLADGTKIIVHICNDIGGWGKGFVVAISKKWKDPEIEYRNWYKSKKSVGSDNVQFERLERRDRYSNEKEFKLGNVQFVKVADDIWVANMIAQRDIAPDKDGIPPIRYSFVSECLERVKAFAKRNNASVHMPRIGCGLAGGQWTEIEEIINDKLIAYEIETTVYDL